MRFSTTWWKLVEQQDTAAWQQTFHSTDLDAHLETDSTHCNVYISPRLRCSVSLRLDGLRSRGGARYLSLPVASDDVMKYAGLGSKFSHSTHSGLQQSFSALPAVLCQLVILWNSSNVRNFIIRSLLTGYPFIIVFILLGCQITDLGSSESISSLVRFTSANLTIPSSIGFRRLDTSLRLVSWRTTWVKYFSRLICSFTAYGTSGIT
ncbi:hypothetical protein EYF80_014293 [Liparis tanakae]|uniref:Uncharacterized protein n=1 Tax=Liparis tanakae TaxID=230148 RepID=A0A4Z2ICN4_9TELE|nr:hypothetical protein EYF80_014293 [Liparis tanakae]